MAIKKYKTQYKLSASMICGDPLNLASELSELEKAKIEYIHFDVMDGIFVPRLGLYPEILTEIKSKTNIPVDVHLMVSKPENLISDFIKAGADFITVHAESTKHLHGVVSDIKKAGVKAGVALNPGTALDTIKYLLDEIDLLLIMAINPGIVGHKLIPSMIQKIEDARNLLGDKKVLIQVDGGVSFNSSAQMVRAGADILVCGTSTIFKQKPSLSKQISKYRLNLTRSLSK